MIVFNLQGCRGINGGGDIGKLVEDKTCHYGSMG